MTQHNRTMTAYRELKL